MELLKRISKFFGGAFFGIGLTLLLFENLKGEINERLMSDEFLDEGF